MVDYLAAADDLSGRQRTITEWYNDHHGWLNAWLRNKLGCSQRAADLAQDAFVRVLALAEPQTIEQPRAFLATTANRLLIDGARRRKIEAAYLDALTAQSAEQGMPDPELIHIALQALERISEMLAGLAPRPREAFLLSRLDGLGYSEIAQHLGVSSSMVKQYIASVLVHCYTVVHGVPDRP